MMGCCSELMDLTVKLVPCGGIDFLYGKGIWLQLPVCNETSGIGNNKASKSGIVGSDNSHVCPAQCFVPYAEHGTGQRAALFVRFVDFHFKRDGRVHRLDLCQDIRCCLVRDVEFLDSEGLVIIRRLLFNQIVPAIFYIRDRMRLIIADLVLMDQLCFVICFRIRPVSSRNPAVRKRGTGWNLPVRKSLLIISNLVLADV